MPTAMRETIMTVVVVVVEQAVGLAVGQVEAKSLLEAAALAQLLAQCRSPMVWARG